MKNLKKLSLLLAALTVSSALATAASAAPVFKGSDNRNDKPAYVAVSNKAPTKKPAPVEEADDIKTNKSSSAGSISNIVFSEGGSTVYTDSNKSKFVFSKPSGNKVTNKPSGTPIKTVFYNSCDLIGGKFYSPEDAEELLEDYFEDNNYDLYLYEGEEQTLCEGAYFYSTDPDVVYYDYRTGKLVANGHGSADVYVYTTGGIPFFRFDVSVYRKTNTVKPVTLDLIPDDWNLSVDDSTTFTVTASNGKTYDDITYSIWHGNDIARISQTTGKLSADKNGAVVVHAYSKSNPDVNGDALVFIGNIAGAVADGGWKYCDGGIRVDSWKDDICDYYYTSKNVCGWLKSAEGILIPVIKFEDAVVDKGGEKVETTILTGGKYSLADLIKEAYGDKDKIVDLITKYNLAKYGIYTEKDCYSYLDCYLKGEDYVPCYDFGVADTDDVLSAIIKGILG